MKKITVLFLTVILCLSLAACKKAPEFEAEPSSHVIQTEAADIGATGEMPQASTSPAQSGNEADESEGPQSIELAGPWHLDSEKNDLDALSDRFPGYAEWGARMELQSNGEMNCYIGAESWQGTYEVAGETLHAELDSYLEELALSWDFHITTENGSAMLTLEYKDMTLYWVYGEQADSAY